MKVSFLLRVQLQSLKPIRLLIIEVACGIYFRIWHVSRQNINLHCGRCRDTCGGSWQRCEI